MLLFTLSLPIGLAVVIDQCNACPTGRSPGSTDCLVEPPQQYQPTERDVLGSMERFPSGSVGTLRSNGSIPTMERVRREISNHSIGSHSQTSSGQVGEAAGVDQFISVLDPGTYVRIRLFPESGS